MGFVLPYLIAAWGQPGFVARVAPSPALRTVGGLVCAAGLALLVAAIRMFILIGRGTIMPWDPTRRLIVAGLYQYVRNPMILGVLILQVGWSILFASRGVALLALVFYVVNTVYFVFSEEPGLEKRFGNEYREYKKNVPRWIPRIRPWRPG